MIKSILARLVVLALVGLLAAAMLGGCGGGGNEAQGAGGCTLGGTAGCGGSSVATPPVTPPVITPAPPVVDPATVPAALSLVFSAQELPTSDTGTVTVTAIVKNASNAALPSTTVTFAADSGLLSAGQVTSDAQGRAKVTLSTGGSRANRAITVTATSGTQTVSATVQAGGTTLIMGGAASVATGAGADLPLVLKDSAGQAISGATVAYATTDAPGVATLRLSYPRGHGN